MKRERGWVEDRGLRAVRAITKQEPLCSVCDILSIKNTQVVFKLLTKHYNQHLTMTCNDRLLLSDPC